MEAVWIIAYVVLGIVAIFFIAMYFRCSVINVNPSQCGASYGIYAVEAGRTGNVISTCGGSGNQPCTFVISTLQEAVELCNDNSDVCTAFYYSELNRNMSYIDPASTLKDVNLGGLYRRNVNPIRVSV